MEEENQVFGKAAEAVDSNENLKTEDFRFYHQNKEEAKKNIDISSKELTDFIDSLTQDIPEPSAEEVNSGVENILGRIRDEDKLNITAKAEKNKKVTLRVLFVAALLSALFFSCIFVVGSSNNISIENGFVTFAKDTIQIAFFGEEKEDFISVESLLLSLEEHGYKNILFPEEFVTNSNKYKVSIPKYTEDGIRQVGFDIYNEEAIYSFGIHQYEQAQNSRDYDEIKNVKSIDLNNTTIFLFEFDSKTTAIEFVYKSYSVYVHSKNAAYSEMEKLAKTLK